MAEYLALSFSSGATMTTHGGNNEWFSPERTQFTNERGDNLWQTTNATTSHADSDALTRLEHMLGTGVLHLLVYGSKDILDRRGHGRIVAHPCHLRNGDRVEKLV